MIRKRLLAVYALLSREMTDLTAYRIVCVLLCFLLPLFWLLYSRLDSVYDPLWMRWILVGACLIALVGSYLSSWIRKHFVGIVYSIIYLISAWFIGLTAINDFAPEYTAGLLFVFMGGTLILGMIRHRPIPLACYLFFFLFLTAAGTYVVPVAEMDKTIIITCVASGALITCLSGYLKIQVEEALSRSESNLKQAQRIASLGHWEWDLKTGGLNWSEEAYRLWGYTSDIGAITPELIQQVIHPKDMSRMKAYQRALSEGKSPEPIDYRIRAQNGEERVLRSHAKVEFDASGNPARVLGTMQDITEQTRYEDQLIAAREEAEEMARLKDTFLTNMSHEIRTPLSVILAATHVLRDETNGEAGHLVDSIEQNGHRLLDTLNGVLDLACLEAGDYRLQCEEIDLVREVREIADTLREAAADKGLVLHVCTKGVVTDAWGDLEAVRRVLTHLINNAIKFTDEGRIAITIETAPDHVQVHVSDTGVGISDSFMPYLFSEFEQESSGLSRKYEGCGLGLALSQRLTALMGGTLTATSEEGHGSTFTMSLLRAEVVHSKGDGTVDPVAPARAS